jgi:hypothetical protein
MKRILKSLAAMVHRSSKRPVSPVRQARLQVEGLEERLALSTVPPFVRDTFYLTNSQTHAIDRLTILTESGGTTKDQFGKPVWNFTGTYTDTAHHFVDTVHGTIDGPDWWSGSGRVEALWAIAFSGSSSGFVRQGVSFYGQINSGYDAAAGSFTGWNWLDGGMSTTYLYGRVAVKGPWYGLSGYDMGLIY